MDFDLTDEQRLLRDSVDRLLADTYTFEKRKGYSAEPEGWSRALWSRYAELGILGLPIGGERDDGAGMALFLVDAKANGVARRAYRLRDGMGAAEISLRASRSAATRCCQRPAPPTRSSSGSPRPASPQPLRRRSVRWKR